MSVDEKNVTITVTLDTNAVGHPARFAAKECTDIFAVAHAALQTVKQSEIPRVAGETIHHQMKIEGRTEDQQLEAYNRRLSAMCISDLSRGIRATMEAAASHIDFLAIDPNDLAGETIEDIQSAANVRLAKFLAAAQALSYPPLLEKVQAGLRAPLTWAPELVSFQKVRNCLEHRGGIVGERDLDDDGVLTLQLPYLHLELVDPDGNVGPIEFGVVIAKASKVQIRVATRTQTFGIGDAVAGTPPKLVKLGSRCGCLPMTWCRSYRSNARRYALLLLRRSKLPSLKRRLEQRVRCKRGSQNGTFGSERRTTVHEPDDESMIVKNWAPADAMGERAIYFGSHCAKREAEARYSTPY